MTATLARPRQSWSGLWNISFGFFGIQIGFALQNANMSRIFQSLGTNLDDLPALWVAAPLTGLLVQPIIGHLSDRTWLGRLGRRRPYFLAGAVLAALALVLMPLAPGLLFAATMLWVLDASLNVSMEPFRAFVGDMLDKDQHAAGYAVQTAFIGAGAVAGSIFPWALEHLGVSNVAARGALPDTVRFAFWFGAVVSLASVIWTVLTTREYSPEEMARFDAGAGIEHAQPDLSGHDYGASLGWAAAGVAVAATCWAAGLEKELYLLGALLLAYGGAGALAIRRARHGHAAGMLGHIIGDFAGMPPLMKRLSVAQFFSWSALFIMWINTTPVVTRSFFGAPDPTSPAYQQGANWVDALFATYNGIAAVSALMLLPALSRRIGRVRTHIVGLLCGAAGFASFLVIRDPRWLLASEVGIGIAWSSILAMPYAILASSLPQRKLGIYMGLFNVFVVLPQLLVATVMGTIMKWFFPDQPIWTMAFAAVTLVGAAAAMLRVRPKLNSVRVPPVPN
ncbi:maltose/moltooligosaccharide transporter [Sphingomonas gellani]|uniref:Maltose/moltooligosaccharide transporter n=1 Tax=Sphingomonas gellani TaxID=1166340 RepID=A0A1H8CVZ1_9SPHN|nr:MFS transporter [Sphingomonas gellani]SEM98508.1 maltose/moltooligosaccharide transporter [Sphingomonas gellani]